jgi:hypothetical protein
MALWIFLPKKPAKKGDALFSFFWARDFCKKSVLARRFFFRVWIFRFVTICRQGCENEIIMVWCVLLYLL